MCDVWQENEARNDDRCEDAGVPGGQDLKGRLVGKDRDRRESGTRGCVRYNLDPRRQESRSDQKQHLEETTPGKFSSQRARDRKEAAGRASWRR